MNEIIFHNFSKRRPAMFPNWVTSILYEQLLILDLLIIGFYNSSLTTCISGHYWSTFILVCCSYCSRPLTVMQYLTKSQCLTKGVWL